MMPQDREARCMGGGRPLIKRQSQDGGRRKNETRGLAEHTRVGNEAKCSQPSLGETASSVPRKQSGGPAGAEARSHGSRRRGDPAVARP